MNRSRRKLKAPKEPDLKFVVPNPTISDSVVPVSYCLSDQALYKIKQGEMLNPYLLVKTVQRELVEGSDPDNPVYTYHRSDSQTQLVPLKQGMLYIQFPKSGHYSIYGLVVNANDNKYSTLYERCINASWNFEVDARGVFKRSKRCGVKYFGDAKLSLEVGPEFFAQEPPQWLKDWSNFMFENKAVDQCQFRRRVLFSFFVQPFILFAWILLSPLLRFTLAAIGTILGYRSINYSVIWDIRNTWFFELFEDTKQWNDSVFLTNKSREARIWALPFFPLLPLVFTLLMMFRVVDNAEGRSYLTYQPSWENALYGIIVYISIILGMAVGLLLLATIAWLVGLVSSTAKKLSIAFAKFIKSKEVDPKIVMERKVAELDYLACTQRAGMAPSLEALPAEQRSLKLRFLDLKSKVCRPYQT